MLIPSLREPGPGKGSIAIPKLAGACTCPHGYLYPLDLPRIHRLLRPMKAKIAAIHLAIKSAPSCGFTAKAGTSRFTNDSSDSETDVQSNHTRDIRNQYGHTRSLRTRHNQVPLYFGRRLVPTASLIQRSDIGEELMADGSKANKGSEILVARFRSSLRDMFKEVVEKVWWQPFCEDHDLPLNTDPTSVTANGLVPGRATLGMACAFAVGRVVSCISEDEPSLMEKHYNIMPAYMRRFAVLEHVVELCISQIPIAQLIVPLLGICARYRADHQALRLLEHLSTCRDKTFQLDHQWAYNVALRIESANAWIAILIRNSPATFYTNKRFQSFVQHIQPQHRAVLIQESFDIHMDTSLFSSKGLRRHLAIQWTSMLIQDSLRLHERTAEGTTSSGDIAVNKCDEVIEYMARYLLVESDFECRKFHILSRAKLHDIGLGLALHSLYVLVTGSSAAIDNGLNQEWVKFMRAHVTNNVQLEDFDAVVEAYRTLTNLNALALMLDAVGLYSLSMKLIRRMLQDFDLLFKNTQEQLGYVCDVTVSSLETYMREVEQRRITHESNDMWRYDEVVGDWVELTPKACRTASLLLDNDESEASIHQTRGQRSVQDIDSSDGLQATLSKSRHTRKIFSLGSRQHNDAESPLPNNLVALSSVNEQLPKNLNRHTVDAPLFTPANRLRYSMTPIQRHVGSSRNEVHYSELTPDLEEASFCNANTASLSLVDSEEDNAEQEVVDGDMASADFVASRAGHFQDEDYIQSSAPSGSDVSDETRDQNGEQYVSEPPEIVELSDTTVDSEDNWTENVASSRLRSEALSSGHGNERGKDTEVSSGEESSHEAFGSIKRGVAACERRDVRNNQPKIDNTLILPSKGNGVSTQLSQASRSSRRRSLSLAEPPARLPELSQRVLQHRRRILLASSESWEDQWSEGDSDYEQAPSRPILKRRSVATSTRTTQQTGSRSIPRTRLEYRPNETDRKRLLNRTDDLTTWRAKRLKTYTDGYKESLLHKSESPSTRTETDEEQEHTSVYSGNGSAEASDDVDQTPEGLETDRWSSEESCGGEEYQEEEDEAMNVLIAESTFRVGAPLPETEPDELSFWI
ncbi:hypothetical protein EDD21DRAFT_26978 [Dissophora ornata]|nr:hypothetical protein EDD21DRAFT_26978 [Dissophora ornata]